MNISLVMNYHLNNKIFDLNDSNVNRDNGVYPYFLLKEKLKEKNIEINTHDVVSPDVADLSIYFDYYGNNGVSKINYLVLFESDVISPKGWAKNTQNKFDKIFTWNDSLVDNKKYFKLNFTHLFPSENDLIEKYVSFKDKKFCTLIAGNKTSSHPNELYSKRVSIIKWFEANQISNFEFYGMGWDRPTSNNKYLRCLFNKKTPINKLFYTFNSYKGSIESKSETLKNYKYTICFENAQNIEGYITEKIFDCFFAGSIPIYWGAPNIREHIPKGCFIDFRDFNSYEELYTFLNEITEVEYSKYIESARTFLLSSQSDQFKVNALSEIILSNVIKDLSNEK